MPNQNKLNCKKSYIWQKNEIETKKFLELDQ